MTAEYAQLIKRAADSVREAGLDPNSNAGAAALRELLGHLLLEASAPRHEGPVSEPTAPRPQTFQDSDSPAARIANWSETAVDRVEDVVEFGDNGVDLHIHTGLIPEPKRARQRMLGLLKLALDKIAYERIEVPAREINAICGRYDCMDQNLPNNLTSYENFITRRGQRGNYIYRVTQFGVDAAREELRRLLRAD